MADAQQAVTDGITNSPTTWAAPVIRWLLNQGATVIVLIVMLGSLSWYGYMQKTVWGPQERKEEAESRNSIVQKHSEAIESVAEQHKEAVNSILTAFKEDRTEQRQFFDERVAWIRDGFTRLADEWRRFRDELIKRGVVAPSPPEGANAAVAGKPPAG